VLPATRLEEFAGAFERVWGTEQERPWTLKVVCAGETAEDARAIEEFQQGAVFIGSLEAKAADARAAKEVLERLPAARARYVEFPPERAGEVLPVLAEYGAKAKIRMGGLTAETIPAADVVARFLMALRAGAGGVEGDGGTASCGARRAKFDGRAGKRAGDDARVCESVSGGGAGVLWRG